ncbi:trypsin-1 [Anabrus simplex]|uniref:trypsin-1 n=1 Tax=Anabrus simplex TaxID=316456 RepID=UPI0034DD55F0
MMKLTTVLVLALVACTLGAERPVARVGFNQGRIVGGTDAQKGQFPYQVSLQYVLIFITQHSCGGSIYTPNWIITAAHCVTEVPAIGHYVAVAGEHNLNSNDGTEQRIRVSKSIVHPDYTGGVGPNDIALMKLQSPLTFNAAVAPISLPAPNAIPTGEAILSGWGSTSQSNSPSMPNILQTATLPLLDYNDCANAVGSDGPLAPTNVCTGPLTGGYSACSGDSGGPLAQRDANGNSVLIGIVSWGFIPCGSVSAPSVYVRVSAFIDFINSNVD